MKHLPTVTVTVLLLSPFASGQDAPLQTSSQNHRFIGDRTYIMFEPPTRRSHVTEDAPPPQIAIGFAWADWPLDRENFDRWLFGNRAGERKRRQTLDRLLAALVENAAWRNSLTEAETAKLRLAGKGDLKRLFDRIEVERVNFEADRTTLATGRLALLRLEPFLIELHKGPFEDDSSFAKTLRKIEANHEQTATIEGSHSLKGR